MSSTFLSARGMLGTLAFAAASRSGQAVSGEILTVGTTDRLGARLTSDSMKETLMVSASNATGGERVAQWITERDLSRGSGKRKSKRSKRTKR